VAWLGALRFNETAGAQISLAGQSRRGDGGEYSSLQSEIYRHWVFEVCSKLISQETNFEMGWQYRCRFSVLEPSFCAALKAVSVVEFADPKKPPEAVLTTIGVQR
jgi:hypothetical protein